MSIFGGFSRGLEDARDARYRRQQLEISRGNLMRSLQSEQRQADTAAANLKEERGTNATNLIKDIRSRMGKVNPNDMGNSFEGLYSDVERLNREYGDLVPNDLKLDSFAAKYGHGPSDKGIVDATQGAAAQSSESATPVGEVAGRLTRAAKTFGRGKQMQVKAAGAPEWAVAGYGNRDDYAKDMINKTGVPDLRWMFMQHAAADPPTGDEQTLNDMIADLDMFTDVTNRFLALHNNHPAAKAIVDDWRLQREQLSTEKGKEATRKNNEFTTYAKTLSMALGFGDDNSAASIRSGSFFKEMGPGFRLGILRGAQSIYNHDMSAGQALELTMQAYGETVHGYHLPEEQAMALVPASSSDNAKWYFVHRGGVRALSHDTVTGKYRAYIVGEGWKVYDESDVTGLTKTMKAFIQEETAVSLAPNKQDGIVGETGGKKVSQRKAVPGSPAEKLETGGKVVSGARDYASEQIGGAVESVTRGISDAYAGFRRGASDVWYGTEQDETYALYKR